MQLTANAKMVMIDYWLSGIFEEYYQLYLMYHVAVSFFRMRDGDLGWAVTTSGIKISDWPANTYSLILILDLSQHLKAK